MLDIRKTSLSQGEAMEKELSSIRMGCPGKWWTHDSRGVLEKIEYGTLHHGLVDKVVQSNDEKELNDLAGPT